MGKPLKTSSAYDSVPTLMHVQDGHQNQTNTACHPEIWEINLKVLLFLGVYTKLDCINSSPLSAALWLVNLLFKLLIPDPPTSTEVLLTGMRSMPSMLRSTAEKI